jgi:hypothetical protein
VHIAISAQPPASRQRRLDQPKLLELVEESVWTEDTDSTDQMARPGVDVAAHRGRHDIDGSGRKRLDLLHDVESETVGVSGEMIECGAPAVRIVGYQHRDKQRRRYYLRTSSSLLGGNSYLRQTGCVAVRPGWIRQPSVIERAGAGSSRRRVGGKPHRRRPGTERRDARRDVVEV